MAKCICHRDLNRRIEVQTPVEAVDAGGFGDVTPTWKTAPGGKVWAKFETVGSREVYRAQQTYATTTHVLTIRFSKPAKAFTTKMRVLYDDRYLYITGKVDVDEQHQWIRLFCTEAV